MSVYLNVVLVVLVVALLVALRLSKMFRKYVSGGVVSEAMLKSSDLSGKTIVITGGNRGIGFEAAKVFYRLGARVIILCRNEQLAKSAVREIGQIDGKSSSRIEYIVMDLADLDSVAQAARKLADVDIHVLLNNAGTMMPPHGTTKQGIEIQFGVNYLGHYLLTRLLYKQLLRSNARIINLSSVAHTMYWWTNPFRSQYIDYSNLRSDCFWTPHNDLYCQSKWAMILFTRELQRRMNQSGSSATAYSLHPGCVLTDLPRFIPSFVMLFVNLSKYYWLKTPFEGAQTSIYLAIAPGVEKHTGEYFKDCKPTTATSASYDEKKSLELWIESEKLVEGYL